MSVLVQKPIPVPTEAQPIRQSPRRNTSPFAQVIDGQRVYDHSPKPPDPDAIARLTRLGLLVVTEETDDTGHVERVVRAVEPKREPRGPVPTYNVKECLELAATGKWTTRELAERYNVDPSTIRGRLRGRMPVERKVDPAKIIELYSAGLTAGKIHKETGHALATIYRIINESPDVERRDDRGRRDGTLTPNQRSQILECRGRLSSRKTATLVGVSPASVRRVWEAARDAQV